MKIHFIHPYLQHPPHPVTVGLIGCGGTGSNMATQLGRMDYSLKELGQPGLHVTVFDGDTITEANPGRQLFSPAEVGTNKAIALVSRLNRFFGTGWLAIPEYYSAKTDPELKGHNIILTCVDSGPARIEIYKAIKQHQGPTQPYTIYYWLDTGNTKDSGQAILGSLQEIKQPDQSKFECVSKLPHLLDLYPNITDHDDAEIQGPSCSVAQALASQDLFINSMIAQFASKLLYHFIKEGFTINNGAFVNLVNLNCNPIKL